MEARPERHPGSQIAGPLHQLAVSSLLTDLYPTLAARELRLTMTRQAEEGGTPGEDGDIESKIGAPQPGSIGAVEQALALTSGHRVPSRSAEALDGNSAFLLQMSQYVLRTGDYPFLITNFASVRQALSTYFDSLDTDGLPVLAAGDRLTPRSTTLCLAALQSGALLSRLYATHAFPTTQVHGGLEGALESVEESDRPIGICHPGGTLRPGTGQGRGGD